MTLEAVKTEPSYHFTAVPPDYVPHVWPEIYNLLAPAVERAEGRWTMPSLLMALCTNGQVLWVAHDAQRKPVAALTSQIIVYPNSKMLAVQFLGGAGFDAWGDAWLQVLESYARDAGCDGVESIARFGFSPFMKRNGFKRSSVLYSKMLEVE